jgi:hypothetical protein
VLFGSGRGLRCLWAGLEIWSERGSFASLRMTLLRAKARAGARARAKQEQKQKQEQEQSRSEAGARANKSKGEVKDPALANYGLERGTLKFAAHTKGAPTLELLLDSGTHPLAGGDGDLQISVGRAEM